MVNGEPLYTAAWHPSTEGEDQVYGWSYEEGMRPYYDVKWMLGWRLKLIDAYVS